MRPSYFLLLLFSCSKAFSLYLLAPEGEVGDEYKKRAYHEVLLKEDYPMCLMTSKLPPSEEKINEKLSQIHPHLKAKWVPTSLFQLFVLEGFFSRPEFQDYVHKLGYGCGFYDQSDFLEEIKYQNAIAEEITTVNIDAKVVKVLSDRESSKEDLYAVYEEINHNDAICSFFLKFNDDFIGKYSENLEDELLAGIPQNIHHWKRNHFPFLYNNYSRDANEDMYMLLRLLSQNRDLIKRVISEEIKAHAEGKHLIYRGAELVFFNSQEEDPVPLLLLPVNAKRIKEEFFLDKGMSSYSLSYANSLFGGIFLSTDACAARYADTTDDFYAFHALKLDHNSLVDDPLFCIPPFHPFSEMIVEGEWFHPHAKIAKKEENQRCYGWFAKANRNFTDHLGFIMHSDSPEELGMKHLNLVSNNAVLMNLVPSDIPFDLKNHHKPIQQLASFSLYP